MFWGLLKPSNNAAEAWISITQTQFLNCKVITYFSIPFQLPSRKMANRPDMILRGFLVARLFQQSFCHVSFVKPKMSCSLFKCIWKVVFWLCVAVLRRGGKGQSEMCLDEVSDGGLRSITLGKTLYCKCRAHGHRLRTDRKTGSEVNVFELSIWANAWPAQ